MIRYDQKDKKTIIEDKPVREQVVIDENHMSKISILFLKELKNLKINNIPIVKMVKKDMIILEPQITVDALSEELGKKLDTKVEFIKDYYMYRLDTYTDDAYGKPVTAIQEYPYSFQQGQNENIILFEFIN